MYEPLGAANTPKAAVQQKNWFTFKLSARDFSVSHCDIYYIYYVINISIYVYLYLHKSDFLVLMNHYCTAKGLSVECHYESTVRRAINKHRFCMNMNT